MTCGREYLGFCCFCVPLKLGAGLIAMFEFIMSVIAIMGLITNDAKFLPNGYNPAFYWLPSIVGAFGIVFSFVGLLGVFDEKHRWVRALGFFMIVKLIAVLLTFVADFWMLGKCDSWLVTTERFTHPNPLMDVIANAHLCRQARSSYLVGCLVDIGFNCFITYVIITFEKRVKYFNFYNISFVRSQYDMEGKWAFYQVNAPVFEDTLAKKRSTYGSMFEQIDLPEEYGPDGLRHPFGPDGQKRAS